MIDIPAKREVGGMLGEIFSFWGKAYAGYIDKNDIAKYECLFLLWHLEINRYAKSINPDCEEYSVYPDSVIEKENLKLKSIDEFAVDFGFLEKR